MGTPITIWIFNISLFLILIKLTQFRIGETNNFFKTNFECKKPKLVTQNVSLCMRKPKPMTRTKINPEIVIFTVNGAGVFKFSQLFRFNSFDITAGNIIIHEKEKSNNFGKLVLLSLKFWKKKNYTCIVYLDRDIQEVDGEIIIKNCAEGKNMISRGSGTYYISISNMQRFSEIERDLLLESRDKHDESFIRKRREWFVPSKSHVITTIMCNRFVARRRQCVHGVKEARRKKTLLIYLSFLINDLFRELRGRLRAMLGMTFLEALAITTSIPLIIIEVIFLVFINMIVELRIDEGEMRNFISRDGGFLLPKANSEYLYHYYGKYNLFISTESFAYSIEQAFIIVIASKMSIYVFRKLISRRIMSIPSITRIEDIKGNK